VQHRLHFLERDALDRVAALDLLGALERQVQLFLHRLGVGIAAHRDVACEDRLIAGNDVDVDRAGAGVEQHDHGAGFQPVVDLVGVLQREGVDIHDYRQASGLGDDAGIVGDLFLLRRHQQDVHGARRLLARAGVENLVVEIHVLDVERDVLLRFPVDGLGELGLGHDRQVDLLDDDRVAGERSGDFLGLERLVLENTADRVGDRGAVDDRPVDDAVGRHRLDRKGHDLETLADGLEFDGLDGARSDVEADDRL
jgi:hypothetical protein